MIIKNYTIKDFKNALESNSFWNTDVFPITKYRVKSQINNPRAGDNDVALSVAYENEEVIGYRGVIPGRIFYNNKEKKIGWLSCWWVAPDYRGKGIGISLLLEVLNAYNYDILIAYSTSSAKRVYDSYGKFVTLKKPEGFSLLFRLNLTEILKRIIPGLLCLKYLFNPAAWLINSVNRIRMHAWKRKRKFYDRFRIEHINKIDKKTSDFIKKFGECDLSRYEAGEFDWIISYPWILSSPVKDITDSKYFFRSMAERFLFLNIKILDSDDNMVAFVIFKLRNNRLSIPYVYCKDNRYDAVLDLAGLIMIDSGAEILIINDEKLLNYLPDSHFPILYKKINTYRFLITDKYKDIDFSKYCIHDGDGDNVFS